MSSLAATKPAVVMATLPTTCAVGQVAFLTSATAGQELRTCNPANVWNIVASGATGTLQADTTHTISCAPNCEVNGLLVPILTKANIWSGSNDMSSSSFFQLPVFSGTPDSRLCSIAAHIGRLSVRGDAQVANASLYVCSQNAASAISWELAQNTNLIAIPTYTATGALISAAHTVVGKISQPSGATSVVTLAGSAAFSSTTSYVCTTDSPTVIAYLSNSSFSMSNAAGNSATQIGYSCSGN